jgi:hypothetical protein
MDPSTITTSTFIVKQGTTPVLGTLSYAGLKATFKPSTAFSANTAYTATVTTGVKDLAGNPLNSSFVWSFTTSASATACGQLPVNLGSSAGFAVVAGSTITNTGPSTVNGDLGLSPGSDVTGFPPGTVVGTIHVADTAAASAIGDLTIAYNDAAGRTLCPVAVAGNLGGQTLTPGLYKSTSGLEITSGDLTLDARGNGNAVFVFQIASTLVTTEGRQTILAGGAKSSNVFWQVGTSASFGTTSAFVGTVMADQSISIDTGATLDGRALARIAAVTLDASTVTKPGFVTVPDTTRPLVSSTSSVLAVPVGSDITATFSEAMDPSTVTATTFTVMGGTTSVAGATTYVGLVATFNPTADLAFNTTYSATITTGVKDLAGNALQVNHAWTFTTITGQVPDTSRPSVSSTSAVVAVALNGDITATFSEAMDSSTITSTTFTVMQATTALPGAVTYTGLTATFNPTTDFANNTNYTAMITVGAKDLAGNALLADFVWSLTTSWGSNCVQTAVNLGSAANFAVLAGSTVTNTGMTTVTGDLGVSPGTAVTGFGPGVVVGTTYAGDPVAAGAIANLSLAYDDAAGRSLCAVSVSGNLGGMTLTPGLYKSTSGLEISSGDLYLDAQGDTNAVFIFQMASTLDVAAGLHVILVNGTKASNVFWQVGTSATLGTGSSFAGTIMADQSIAFHTGATLDGRALARIGAVTLDACTVTKPSA